jgi:membrane fusion protein (multidrug efflux system)
VIYLNEGDPVSLLVNVYPSRRFNGVITYAGIKADEKEGAFPVIIELENDDDMLRPGMITTVRIPKQKVSGALVVPRDAVVERGNALFVFTVMDGVARQRRVTLGAMQDQEVVILSGLKKGETVVVQGQEVLQDNTRVTVQGSEM